MLSAPQLLADCQRLVRSLEDDLRERIAEQPDLDAPVRAEFERAKAGQRTAQSYTVWRDEYLTQVAVHWVLAAVFVRFLEDNGCSRSRGCPVPVRAGLWRRTATSASSPSSRPPRTARCCSPVSARWSGCCREKVPRGGAAAAGRRCQPKREENTPQPPPPPAFGAAEDHL